MLSIFNFETKMGNVQSNLNIFICGNTLSDENMDLMNNLFPETEESIRFDGTEYNFRIRKLKKKEIQIQFSIYWKCFILDQKLDSNLSEKLINYIISLTDKNQNSNINYHNAILYLSGGNEEEKVIIDKIMEKKGEFSKISDKKVLFEDKIPFLIIYNSLKRDDTNILRHINFIPKLNYQKNIDNIKNKLISIDAYYNEKGTLYKDLFQNAFTSLSIKILLFGKVGAGKTAFLNTSFGELVSRSSSSMKSVTSKCIEYLLPYNLKNKKCGGRIMLIDTPGFENEKTVKNVKQLIETYTKKAKDSKDIVHCALFFLKEGDRICPYENEIFEYLFKEKIKVFFVVTRSFFKESKTKSSIIEHFKNFKNINSEQIINVNLVKEKLSLTEEEDEEEEKIVDVPIKGIKKVYNTIYKFLQHEIYNEKIFNDLKLPKTIQEKLNLLKEISFLFNAFNSIEDLKKGSHIKATAIVATSSSLAGACGFIPVPFVDIAPVIIIQVSMILALAKIYGITKDKYNLKDVILSGGCTLGDAAINAGVQGAMKITGQGFKTVFKEVAEEVIDDAAEQTIKAITKEILKGAGEKGSTSIVKVVPVIGTILGGLVSAGINAGFTALMGERAMKLFEEKLLGDDNGYSFLVNRIKGYLNIFEQIKFYAEKKDWGFEEWV